MDRRQQKTRKAIFEAFSTLLEKKNCNQITVQEIIDAANIGRSTFYAHFETKDELLREVCHEVFGHVISSALDQKHIHGSYSDEKAPSSVFCHLLQHLQKNDNHIAVLLTCENSEIFMRYFKDCLNELVRTQLNRSVRTDDQDLPEDFLVNHVASSFVEMVLWWFKGGMKQTPEQLDQYFHAVIDPIL